MKIEKRAWPEFFQALADGEKTFDLRLNDFECKPGDILVLREWDPETRQYTGRILEMEIGYVLRFKPEEFPFWPQEKMKRHGFQIISLKTPTPPTKDDFRKQVKDLAKCKNDCRTAGHYECWRDTCGCICHAARRVLGVALPESYIPVSGE